MSADLQRIIRIVFKGANETGNTFSQIGGDISKFGSAVGDVTQPLANMHDRVLKLQTALGAMAIGGLALSVNAAKDFDSQFRELTTLIDDTGEGIDRFRQDIKAYASDSTLSIEDINKALYSAISAGIDYADSLDFLSTAERLAVAGKADLESTTRLLASTLNAYGASVDEAGRYSDVFFQTVKLGQTTMPELAQSLSQVTSIAAAAGIPIETVGAAIATLTAKGMPTTEAMTAIKGAISSIINPTKQASDYAAELGIQFDANALASKGLEGVLLDVWNATDGNVDAVAQLFGNVRGLTGVLAAFGQDGGEDFIAKQQQMRDAAGSTAEAFDKMAGDISLVNQGLVNNFKLTLVEIGDKVLGEYGEMVGGISDIFKAIQQAVRDGSFDDIFDVLSNIAGDLTKTFEDVARNLPGALADVDFSEFSKAIERLAGETGQLLRSLFGDFDFSTSEGLTQAIQRIVDVMKSMTEVTEGIVKGWQPWAKLLGDTIDKMSQYDTETNNAIGQTLQLGKVINTLSGFVESAGGALDAFGTLMKVIAAQRLVSLVTSLGSASGALGGLGTAATAAAGTAAGKLGLAGIAYYAGWTAGSLINEYVPAVGKAAQSLFGWVDGLTDFTGKQAAATKEAEAFDKLVDAIASNIGDFNYDLGDLRKRLEGLGHDLSDLSGADVIRLAAEVDVLSFETAMEIIRTKVPDEKEVELALSPTEKIMADLKAFGMEVDEATAERILGIELDKPQAEQATKELGEILRKPSFITDDGIEFAITTNLDGTVTIEQLNEIKKDVKGAVEKVQEETPDIETELKFKELDLKAFEAQLGSVDNLVSGYYDTIQSSIEWEAKLQIAEVEANAQRVEAIMDSVSASVEGAANVLSSIFENAADLRDAGFWRSDIERWIEREMEIQERALEVQEAMAEAEIKWMEARTTALEKGEGLIQIDGQGLQPHLEAFMFEILSGIQTRANAEGAAFLIGR